MTLIGNRTSVIIPIREALDRAELKYKTKKYFFNIEWKKGICGLVYEIWVRRK